MKGVVKYMNMKKSLKMKMGEILCLCIISFMFVMIYSFSTSPLYPRYWGSDSAQFQTIGKAWGLGKLPYVDTFDHKGPLIFLVNMVGYKFFGRSGVMLCQVFFFFFTLLGIYKFTEFMQTKQYIKWIGMAITIISIIRVYSNGNMSEEYCIPFLMFSAYGQYDYFKHMNRVHSVWWGFFYGISVSIALMTRATNAIPVLCGIFVIICILLKNKQYYNILCNAVFFLLGSGVILGPFAIYFAMNGAFNDFMFGTITYNIIYTRSMHSWMENADIYMVFSYIRFFFPAIVCFPAAIFALYNKNWYLTGFYLLVGLIENIFFCKGAFYPHYVMIAIPNVIMVIVETTQALQGNKGKIKNLIRKSLIVVSIIGLSIIIMNNTLKIKKKIYNYATLQEEYNALMNVVPQKDLDKMMVYGGGTLKDFYLRYDIIPCYKYFVLQDAHGERSSYVRDDIHSEFLKLDAEWIMTDRHTEIINDILEQYYEKVKEDGIYALYRLKEEKINDL